MSDMSGYATSSYCTLHGYYYGVQCPGCSAAVQPQTAWGNPYGGVLQRIATALERIATALEGMES